MSRTTKRFLSILLAAAMILSLGITGWAEDDIRIVNPDPEPAPKTDEHVTEGFAGGTELELREIDPSGLNVSRLGEVEAEDETLAAEELPFGLNDIVRVSIVLDKPATMDVGYATNNIVDNGSAMAYRQSLKNQQAQVEAAIAGAGVSINVKWNLTLAVNIISAEVRYGDIETIKAVAGVKEVWLETRYEPQLDDVNTVITTEHMVGATAAWANGYTGAGSRIAIIDTGTNQDHISFADDAFLYALDQDGGDYDLLGVNEISSVLSELNANNTAAKHDISSAYYVYKNAKIPFAYNYIDGNNTTDHYSDSQGEHGSHVSGIAAANRFVKQDGKFVDAASTVFAVGVAPDAQILTMKVFGAAGGAYDSDYMAAIEDAIILKADSVNLSLGSSNPGLSFSNGYQEVMDGLINSGTVVTMSAGNSGSWADNLSSEHYGMLYLEDVSLHTGGSPGSFVNSLGTASADNIGQVGTPLQFGGYDSPVFFSETSGYGNEPIATIPGEYEFVLVDGPGVSDNDYSDNAFAAIGSEVLTGKVAMCYRGSSSFFAKANAAVEQGAVAVVIINNTTGVINMNLTGYEYTAPAVSILKADGDAVKAAATPVTDEEGNVLYYTGTVTISDQMSAGLTGSRSAATMSSFSAWGVPGSLILKPELTSPGGSIYSVNGMTDDGFEVMSGTSMASPHTAGMAAVLGQYIRENNLEEVTGINRRTLINSLLMSTSTPMIGSAGYYSVLQQGSGLADVFAATQAKAYILMDDNATASAADGKVKVELGQDAARTGSYSFSYTVNNFSDIDLFYELYTDIFTQFTAGSDGKNWYLDTDTTLFTPGEDFFVSYNYPNFISGHDVNKDGATNRADVQALVDFLAGNLAEDKLDLAAGEMDGVDGISSYDAELLLQWLIDEGVDYMVVPAGESVQVTVNLQLNPETTDFLTMYMPNGFYVEGFTYLLPATETEDGEILDVMYSIPILGYFGSWTDPSMFDCVSLIDTLYGTTKTPYTGNTATNYMTVNYGKGNTPFYGNPYVVEDEFPAERLAINPSTSIVDFKYNLIRNAGTSGWLALDEDNNVLASKMDGSQYGAYYYVNGGTWQLTTTTTAKVNTTAKRLGLDNGEVVTIGYFAVPEYYGTLLHPGEGTGAVSAEEIGQLLNDGELGQGAYVGYTLTVDAFVPEVISAAISEDGTQISVKAKDNAYIAYVALMDYTGNTEFAGTLPEQAEPGEEVEITFDISELELPNGVAVFVGDYAGNERAYLLVIDPEKPVTKTVWMLTDTLEAGNDYIIANAAEGTIYALNSQGQNYYTNSVSMEVTSDDNGAYIPSDEVVNSAVWTASDGVVLTNKNDGGVLGYNSWGSRFVSWANPAYADEFTYIDGALYNFPDDGEGLFFQGGSFYYYYAGPVFLFTKAEIEVDPYAASEVIVTPDAATLILDVLDTVELVATVKPIVLPDLSVTWTSSDETVATVDENGLVTAVGAGTAIITASSNQTPEVVGTATIQVTTGEPMDAVVYGMIETEEGVQYGPIDLSTMAFEDISEGQIFSSFYGGGRSGDFIYGNDVDNDFHRYNVEEGFAYDSDYHFVIAANWAAYDIACFPAFTLADYSGVTEENPDPNLIEYNRVLTALNGSSYLYFADEEGSLTYFDLSSLGNFIAVTFAGVSFDEDGANLYYILLDDAGNLILFGVYGNAATGGMSGFYDELGHVNILSIGEDKTAYSLSYYEESDEVWGVFVADSSIGGVYFVNLAESGEGAEIDAQFVGKIEGAECLTTLSDFYFDTLTGLGVVEIGLPEEEGSDALPGSKLAQAVSGQKTLASFESIEGYLFETETEGDISIEPEDGEIVIVGGLDAVKEQPARSTVVLNAAELVNPESYEDDEVVVINVTAPEATEDTEAFYNGLITVEFDPNALSFQSFAPAGIEYKSFKVDAEAGKITFAFVSSSPIPASAVLGQAKFVNLTQDTVVTVTAKESNENVNFNEVTEIKLDSSFELSLSMSTAGIQLSWTEVKNAENYEAQILIGDTWKSLGTTAKLKHLDEDVLMGETYTYRVRAYKNGAWTGFCKEQSVVFNPFSDIPSTGKTFDYVSWAYNSGVITGMTTTTFAPNKSCTRVQFVMMLWKAAGSPVVEGTLPFSDVTGAKTSRALLWALDQGIIIPGETFNPNGKISREQVVIILWKLAGSPEVEGTCPFTDVKGAKTQKAVLWAYQNGIVKGTSETTFAPTRDCTRVQLVVLLYKYNQLFHVVNAAEEA